MNDYLYDFLLSYKCKNKKIIHIFKNFLAFCIKNHNFNDHLILKTTNFLSLREAFFLNLPSNYADKYLDFKITKNEQVIALLNGFFWFSKNLSSKIRLNSETKNVLNFGNFYNDYKYINLFYILNYIFQDKPLLIKISDSFNSEKPLYILNFFYNTVKTSIASPRLNIIFGENSKINILNINFGKTSNMFLNFNLTFLLKKKSLVNYFFFNRFNSLIFNTCSIFSKQEESSLLEFNEISSNNQLYKGFYNFFLSGKKNISIIKIAKKLKFESISEIICNIIHDSNLSLSNVKYCVVTEEKAKAFFRGNICTNIYNFNIQAKLICDGLLLSDAAIIKNLPELSINNNVLKCSHGSIIGFINCNIIYYMQARSLSENEAKKIIISIFLSKCINNSNIFYNILNNSIYKNYFMV